MYISAMIESGLLYGCLQPYGGEGLEIMAGIL